MFNQDINDFSNYQFNEISRNKVYLEGYIINIKLFLIVIDFYFFEIKFMMVATSNSTNAFISDGRWAMI